MRHIENGGHWACMVLAVFIAGCGGSADSPVSAVAGETPVEPLSAFTSQYLYWSACSSSLLVGLYAENPGIKNLGSRISCATMYVPQDHANPWGGQVSIALLKVSARKPAERQGSLFFNPGGPGGDGLALPAHFAALAELDDPTGKAILPLTNRYDFIGFSPRGTGSSTQLICSSYQTSLPAFDNGDRSTSNVVAMLRNNRLVAHACLANPLTPFINTEQTARDLDRARALVGDARLNYIGYSYGTWLGAWYAGLFPDRVGRMLLDSNVNFRDDLENTIRQMPVGFQRVLDGVVAAYAARHHDVFGLGASAAEVRQVFTGLPIRMRGSIRTDMVNMLYRSDNVRASLLTLVAAKGVDVLLRAYPGRSLADQQLLIQRHRFAPGTAENEEALPYALSIMNLQFAAPANPVYVRLPSPQATGVAVICNDTEGIVDEQALVAYTDRQALDYPLIGGAATSESCLHWGGPKVNRPAISSVAQAPGALMLQSQFDGATPVEGAMAIFDALPKAGMVLVSGEYSHGLFPYRTACVDQAVADYFTSGKLPGRKLDCPGRPMPGELDGALALVPGKDAARAGQIVRQIHRAVEAANKRF